MKPVLLNLDSAGNLYDANNVIVCSISPGLIVTSLNIDTAGTTLDLVKLGGIHR